MKKIVPKMLILMFFLTACSTNEQTETSEKLDTESPKSVELTVSAAASLQDALTDISEEFEKEHSTIKINYNFGASGALQQQISQGAPVDLFFSAAEDKFDTLVAEGLIEEKNGIDLVGNSLVLVTPKNSSIEMKSFNDMTKANTVALGTPESVPAGKYGKDTLENIGVWDDIEDRVVFAKDVRQVLTYVETNNVDAGIVYQTDALTSDKVNIVATAEEDLHGPIIYPLGIVNNSSHLEEAELFYNFLKDNHAINILVEYGFKDLR
ncbi:molybdate ABC transporter substrate-binding protein [Bacillus sp. B1-b2]|uniref:molybdate ABC transporter substrate-binding protein n=1 Tax=Bacillus sp. B1-b2 TaxID=2653201 RepID=UPI0012617C1A|nr:molybdate ABC transporter substrate-binding protein [Bacillus sp. B1-b2]KAB7669939.1 molybdate ABC transporter substrate-binding protein [Bacillus sp. B1-b2]